MAASPTRAVLLWPIEETDNIQFKSDPKLICAKITAKSLLDVPAMVRMHELPF
jgi:hypothetical protein